MLTNTLNTNEVKNSAGAEVSFTRLKVSDRHTEFAQVDEAPAMTHRLTISHQETGNGLGKRRRSVVRVDKTVVSTVDNSTPVVCSAYIVLDTPVGALIAYTEPTHVLAELISFCASLGASTTILYDGTGNGAQVLLNGGL